MSRRLKRPLVWMVIIVTILLAVVQSGKAEGALVSSQAGVWSAADLDPTISDTTQTVTVYFPVVFSAASLEPDGDHHTLDAPDNVYLSSVGGTYEEAVAGENIMLREENRTTGGWNDPPNPYYSRYLLTRGVSTYQLGDLASQMVLSAALDLLLCTAGTPLYESTTMTLYLSTESGDITEESWDQIGEPLGTATILSTGVLAETDRRIWLPLSGTLPAQLRFVWKADESRAYPNSVGAAFDLTDCYGTGTDDLTTLHLWTKAGD